MRYQDAIKIIRKKRLDTLRRIKSIEEKVEYKKLIKQLRLDVDAYDVALKLIEDKASEELEWATKKKKENIFK